MGILDLGTRRWTHDSAAVCLECRHLEVNPVMQSGSCDLELSKIRGEWQGTATAEPQGGTKAAEPKTNISGSRLHLWRFPVMYRVVPVLAA